MIAEFDEEQAAALAAREQDKEHDMIIFDIETGPAPLSEIELIMPKFSAPSNYKDAAKIAAIIDDQRDKFIERAALSPLSGRVIAIGAWVDGQYRAYICEAECGSERHCIEWFWNLVGRRSSLIGFNSNSFDLPFLFRRSWALGIAPPPALQDRRMGFSPPRCWDLMDIWRCGDRTQFISLDAVSRFLGIGEKTQDGEFFHKLVKADPEEAAIYLENDVKLTFEMAKRLNILGCDPAWSIADEVTETAAPTETDEY